MQGRAVLVTGAAGGIGKCIARQLASQGAELVLVCRSIDQCKETESFVRGHKGCENVVISNEAVDLSLHSSIAAFGKRFRDSGRKLHVLLNNAATVPHSRTETKEGLETQFAVNIMSYHWLTMELAPVLAKNATEKDPARVVLVASGYAGGLDLKDIQFKHRSYDNNEGYRQSKQANRMQGALYADKLGKLGFPNIVSYSCYPGFVTTKLATGLGFQGPDTAESAAETPVFCASDPSLADHKLSGKYVSRKRVEPCRFVDDKAGQATLWDIMTKTTEELQSTK